MRVFHFLSSEYGLSDIALQRMKIARFGDLNDPFELLAANVGGSKKRRKMLRSWKGELNDTKGLLCFSKDWKNPLLWSHYAAMHYGFCLGFDLKDGLANEVKYSAERIEFNGQTTAGDLNEELAQTLLLTKFCDWSYEDEIRVFVDLDKHAVEGATYFYEFSTDLVLQEVILGPLCDIPGKKIRKLVNTSYESVDVITTRLAFKSFNVVQRKHFST